MVGFIADHLRSRLVLAPESGSIGRICTESMARITLTICPTGGAAGEGRRIGVASTSGFRKCARRTPEASWHVVGNHTGLVEFRPARRTSAARDGAAFV